MINQPEKRVKLDLDSLSLLELCASIEMKCAELYRFFAVYCADVPGLAALWTKTANEEDNHAEQFRLAVRLRGRGIENIKADLSKIEVIIEKLNTFLPRFKESNPTPKQALTFAIQLEEKLVECHMCTLVDFADNDIAKLFQAMAKNDVEHLEMLRKASKKISAD